MAVMTFIAVEDDTQDILENKYRDLIRRLPDHNVTIDIVCEGPRQPALDPDEQAKEIADVIENLEDQLR
jgi:hypothetical protein